VAVITGPPAPYREPVFAELARRPGLDVNVFHAATGHADLGWQAIKAPKRDYPHVFLENFMPESGRRLPGVGYLSFGLPAELSAFRPDYMIVYGYNQLSQWLAFRYAMTHEVPFALRSDSNVYLDRSETWQSSIRRRLLHQLVRRAHAVLPVGSANRQYWQKYGAVDSQIFMAPYAIDNDKVNRLVGERPSRDPSAPLRLLYLGRLLQRKGVDLLLGAFNRLVATTSSNLTIIGDGPERANLQSMQTASARQQTHWLGKLSNEEAMTAMRDADLFVLPSRYEPWGLVVNEAMAAGLAVVAHREVGAVIDLVEDTVHGWILPTLSVDTIYSALEEAARDREHLAQMGRMARARVREWSIQRTVDGMVAAIKDGCSAWPAERERVTRA
jgi:glycosyltransferase involved in cell wall biosynthesis